MSALDGTLGDTGAILAGLIAWCAGRPEARVCQPRMTAVRRACMHPLLSGLKSPIGDQ